MKTLTILLSAVMLAGLALVGCDKAIDATSAANSDLSTEPDLDNLMAAAWPRHHEPVPGPLVDVSFGSQTLTFWPYTGHDFSGDPVDPINLIFVGKADPLDIRTALMSLDGDRTALGFPGAPPFNATWQDAIGGDIQNTYGEPTGWSGSAIQLACGGYEPARVHLRLFRVGNYTLGGAHFEILVPGTTEHQVLSWELAEQLVTADLMRSGLLDSQTPIMPTGTINVSPFRTIPSIIYNLLPDELKMLAGGWLGEVTEDVPIWTDGSATLLNLANRVKWHAGVWDENIVIDFDQAIPKPFCASGPYDYVYVTGPVRMTQTVRISMSGQYSSCFRADGDLAVTPLDPMTGAPNGETLNGRVFQLQTSLHSVRLDNASCLRYQALTQLGTEGSGWFFERFRVSSRGGTGYQLITECESDQVVSADLIANADEIEGDNASATKRLVNIR